MVGAALTLCIRARRRLLVLYLVRSVGCSIPKPGADPKFS